MHYAPSTPKLPRSGRPAGCDDAKAAVSACVSPMYRFIQREFRWFTGARTVSKKHPEGLELRLQYRRLPVDFFHFFVPSRESAVRICANPLVRVFQFSSGVPGMQYLHSSVVLTIYHSVSGSSFPRHLKASDWVRVGLGWVGWDG